MQNASLRQVSSQFPPDIFRFCLAQLCLNVPSFSQGMWEFVSSRTCTSPNSVVPQVQCASDSECFDGNSCTVDTCNISTNQCSNTMSSNCCGNFICEFNEYASCSDCAFTLATAFPSGTFGIGSGMMFDVEAKGDVVIRSLTFYPYDGSGTVNVIVTLYTTSGGYSGKENTSGSWTKIIDGQSISTTSETYLTFVPISLYVILL